MGDDAAMKPKAKSLKELRSRIYKHLSKLALMRSRPRRGLGALGMWDDFNDGYETALKKVLKAIDGK